MAALTFFCARPQLQRFTRVLFERDRPELSKMSGWVTLPNRSQKCMLTCRNHHRQGGCLSTIVLSSEQVFDYHKFR